MGKPGQLKRPMLEEGPLKELNDALHDLHLRAGRPSLTEMVRLLDKEAGISRSRLHDAMTAEVLPRWDVVDALVEILADKARGTSPEQELDRFATAWQRAARATDDSNSVLDGSQGSVRSHQASAVEQRLVVAIDELRYAARTHTDQLMTHHHLTEILGRSLSALQVDLHDTYQQDTGDGVVILFSPSIPSPYITSMWVALLHEELQRINPEGPKFHLRIGMQKGATSVDHVGISGTTVNGAMRLSASDRATSLLRESGGLVLGISDALYKGAVRGYNLANPDKFKQATVRTKTGVTLAWFRVMGSEH